MRKVHLGLGDLGVSVSSLVIWLSLLVSPEILIWLSLPLLLVWLRSSHLWLLRVLLLLVLVKPGRRVLEEHWGLEEGASLKRAKHYHFLKLE